MSNSFNAVPPVDQPVPVGPLAQVVAGSAALDEGHDPLCMAVLRGKVCTCGVLASSNDQGEQR